MQSEEGVVVSLVPGARVEPPDGLTDRQAEIWRATAASKPAEWFSADSVPMLRAYVVAVDAHMVVSAALAKAAEKGISTKPKLTKYKVLLDMQARQAAVVASLATKMRLTQQSRYTPMAASTASKKAPDGRKPWEHRSTAQR